MDVSKLLQSHEGKTLEFKRDISSKDRIIRTVVAFANTSGGVLVIGVDDDKNIRGVEDPLKVEEALSSAISDSIFPQLLPNIEIASWMNKELVIVEVFSGPQKPYYVKSKGAKDGVYFRIGSSSRVASLEFIEEFKRSALNRTFDEEVFLEKSSEGIDLRLISEYISELGRRVTESALKTLRLLTVYGKEMVPTNGAYVLFGKDRLKFFPDAMIKAALFAGVDKSEMLDSSEFESPLIEAIEQTLVFVKRNIQMKSDIGELYRKDTFRYPIGAIREALINSVVHCDYSLKGAPITVGIFSDRIEITNPGMLPLGLTMEDIYKGISKLRNRVIGRFFREINLIEQWGSGIGRMIKYCADAGIKSPKFEEIGTQFRVTFYGTRKGKVLLSPEENMILKALKSKNGLSTRELANIIKKTERTTRLKMIRLIDKGLVLELGSNKNDPNKKYFLVK